MTTHGFNIIFRIVLLIVIGLMTSFGGKLLLDSSNACQASFSTCQRAAEEACKTDQIGSCIKTWNYTCFDSFKVCKEGKRPSVEYK